MLALWTPEVFDRLPDRIRDDLLSALHYGTGERSFEDLVQECRDGEKQIWMHTVGDKFNATVITQISLFPGKKTCEILYLGGDTVLEHLGDIKEIEDFAREQGCHDIQAIGRPGWVRAMRAVGYEQRYSVTGKIL